MTEVLTDCSLCKGKMEKGICSNEKCVNHEAPHKCRRCGRRKVRIPHWGATCPRCELKARQPRRPSPIRRPY